MIVNMTVLNASTQAISIRRFKAVYVPALESLDAYVRQDDRTLAALQSRVGEFGFMLSLDVLKDLSKMEKSEFIDYVDDLTDALIEVTGKRPNNKAFYPNFPRQVAEASEVELFHNAMMHYFGASVGLRITPVYPVEDRDMLPIEDMRSLTVLNATRGPVDINMLFNAKSIILNANSISDLDMGDVAALAGTSVQERENFFFGISNDELIGMNRENKARAVLFARGDGGDDAVGDFEAIFRVAMTTATDVLRYAVGRSGGQVSLAQSVNRFVAFSRAERRMMLSAINGLPAQNVMEDFGRHESAFRHLMTVLHPREYAKLFPKADSAFKRLAEGSLPRSFAGKLDMLMDADGDIDRIIAHVKNRPGEFARSLNRILTWCDHKKDRKKVLKAFEAVVDEVPEKILWSMSTLFEFRNVDNERVIYPKGSVANARIIPMPQKAYGDSTAQRVVDIISASLVKRYSGLEPLGKVYVDPALASYTIPTNLRSASRSLRTLGRGSRVSFDDKPVQRFFLWWTEESGFYWDRIDVDLSAIMFNENFEIVSHVSYTNLRDGSDVVHSGDYTSAPNGAAEYIDVNVNALVKRGIRYVSMNVYSYTGQTFDNFECLAGIMGRTKPQAGSEFDARTVANTFEVSAPAVMAMPLILDLVTREMIWADMSGQVNIRSGINVERTKGSGVSSLEGSVKKRYSSLYQQLVFHVLARGELVEDRAEADVVYGPENLEEIYQVFPIES